MHPNNQPQFNQALQLMHLVLCYLAYLYALENNLVVEIYHPVLRLRGILIQVVCSDARAFSVGLHRTIKFGLDFLRRRMCIRGVLLHDKTAQLN